jgi:glycosyltransferase involved in cell wall biosynthesis
MKLLICTQAVDRNDPILGFFVRWIEEFAKHCERVTVICLREGEHSLPENVSIYEIGPGNKIVRTMRFWRLLMRVHGAYDRIFVHMNPEYLVLGGLYWRTHGIPTALWYTHKNVDLKLRIAERFANHIFTASKTSFRLPSSKVHVMGHGIDTNFFTPDTRVMREGWWLSVGRLTKSKRHDLAIEIAHGADKELRIAGDGPEGANLVHLANALGAHVEFLGGLTQTQLRDAYRKAALLIHTSETGSLDKVVLEALACGLAFRTNDSALASFENEGPAYVREQHSLERLIPAMLDILS